MSAVNVPSSVSRYGVVRLQVAFVVSAARLVVHVCATHLGVCGSVFQFMCGSTSHLLHLLLWVVVLLYVLLLR